MKFVNGSESVKLIRNLIKISMKSFSKYLTFKYSLKCCLDDIAWFSFFNYSILFFFNHFIPCQAWMLLVYRGGGEFWALQGVKVKENAENSKDWMKDKRWTELKTKDGYLCFSYIVEYSSYKRNKEMEETFTGGECEKINCCCRRDGYI